jgi:hypothetical protein
MSDFYMTNDIFFNQNHPNFNLSKNPYTMFLFNQKDHSKTLSSALFFTLFQKLKIRTIK